MKKGRVRLQPDRYTMLEAPLRLAIFIAVFASLAVWEWRRPRRRPALRGARWRTHFSLAALNTLVVRLIAPGAGVTFALWAQRKGWGVLPATAAPPLLQAILAVGILDLTVYMQHRMFHAVPVLWRMHRMHHADVHVDVTTGVRFHPFEIAISTLIKGTIILALGASPVAVITFEAILNAGSLFSHANGFLSTRTDAWLRRVVVTPDMHRVHHSIVPGERNTNFGFNVSWWDRLFGTYTPAPSLPQESMRIGLPEWQDGRVNSLRALLADPLAPHGATSSRPASRPQASPPGP
jgi:sterol desaturase/sphingolipid hydroxylase (fatty acid hydroxylase superfamily)